MDGGADVNLLAPQGAPGPRGTFFCLLLRKPYVTLDLSFLQVVLPKPQDAGLLPGRAGARVIV